MITNEQWMWLDTVGVVAVAAVLLGFGLFWGLIGAFFGSYKNRKTRGLFLCTILGPIGLLPLLFSSDGTRDEGMSDMFMALVLAAVVNVMGVWFVWNGIAKPMIVRIEAAEQQQVASEKSDMIRSEKEGERRVVELETAQASPDLDSPTIPEPPPTRIAASEIFPPGVDTPEERREYLQTLAEAKKSSGAPQSRTSVRVRGY